MSCTDVTFYNHVLVSQKLLNPMNNFLYSFSFLPPQSLFSKPLSFRELGQDYLLFMAWLLFCHFYLANPKERGHEKEVLCWRAM